MVDSWGQCISSTEHQTWAPIRLGGGCGKVECPGRCTQTPVRPECNATTTSGQVEGDAGEHLIRVRLLLSHKHAGLLARFQTLALLRLLHELKLLHLQLHQASERGENVIEGGAGARRGGGGREVVYRRVSGRVWGGGRSGRFSSGNVEVLPEKMSVSDMFSASTIHSTRCEKTCEKVTIFANKGQFSADFLA